MTKTHAPTPWPKTTEARFFNAIAEGASIACASRLVNKSIGAGASQFRRYRVSLGEQGT